MSWKIHWLTELRKEVLDEYKIHKLINRQEQLNMATSSITLVLMNRDIQGIVASNSNLKTAWTTACELLLKIGKVQTTINLQDNTTAHYHVGDSVGTEDVSGDTTSSRCPSICGAVIDMVRAATHTCLKGYDTIEPGRRDSLTKQYWYPTSWGEVALGTPTQYPNNLEDFNIDPVILPT